MRVLPKLVHRPSMMCLRIAMWGAVSLAISAVLAAGPPEASGQQLHDPNGPQDSTKHEAGFSHHQSGCDDGATFFQPAKDGVRTRLPIVEARIDPEIDAFRDPGSEPSDRRAVKFVPASLGRSSNSAPVHRIATHAVPSCMRRVTITSNPCGATIYVDGIQMGRTPMSFPVPQGRYALVLLAPGHRRYAQWIFVPDAPLEIQANLTPEK